MLSFVVEIIIIGTFDRYVQDINLLVDDKLSCPLEVLLPIVEILSSARSCGRDARDSFALALYQSRDTKVTKPLGTAQRLRQSLCICFIDVITSTIEIDRLDVDAFSNIVLCFLLRDGQCTRHDP